MIKTKAVCPVPYNYEKPLQEPGPVCSNSEKIPSLTPKKIDFPHNNNLQI